MFDTFDKFQLGFTKPQIGELTKSRPGSQWDCLEVSGGRREVLSSVLPGVRLRDEIKPAGNKIQHQPPGTEGIIGLEYFPF